MPEIQPDDIPNPVCVIGWDGTRYRAFAVDAAGHLQLDVVTSGLPAGAATAAHQVTQNAALATIASIADALQSVATDRLIVRGEDQLHSFEGVLCTVRNAAISGAGGFCDSPTCAAGYVWHVTAITATDATSPTTEHEYHERRAGVDYLFHRHTAAFPAWASSQWGGDLWLRDGDVIRVYFLGGLAGDSVWVRVLGEVFTEEV